MQKILCPLALVSLLAACAAATSWEERCSQGGAVKGSAEYKECVAAGERWSSEVVQAYSGWSSKAY
jgi:hypothetical protein